MTAPGHSTIPKAFTHELEHDFSERAVDHLFIAANEAGISDLIIQSGDYIFGKWRGTWVRINGRQLEHNEVERIISLKYGSSGVAKMDTGIPLDFRLKVVETRDKIIGNRAHSSRRRIGPSEAGLKLIARRIPGLPPKWSSMGIEKELSQAFFPSYGLILVVGTTGSGKSTLMASALRRRLEDSDRPVHIGTFEDPIEFTFGNLGLGRMPLVSQAEIGIGSDLRDFEQVGRSAMRSAFDVIVAGELRDKESVKMGLELAETGHCVMATLHTETPAQAIDRIISFFPPEQQPSIASTLRATLRVVVAQKLLNTTHGDRLALRSWLTFDRQTKNILTDYPHSKWQSVLENITYERKNSFEHQALAPLSQGVIDFREFLKATSMTYREAESFLSENGVWLPQWAEMEDSDVG